MIPKVSMTNNSVSFSANKKENQTKTTSKLTPYVDSFVKHASDSAPVMVAVTGAWTAYDVVTKKSKLKTALANNVLGFLAPVLLASSAILAVVENKKTSKSSN